jgi:4-diphosphocytidyl-2-C-methyl-D-erythritol kinase
MTPDKVTIAAHGKLNLALSVGPPDAVSGNYHPIASWMAPIDIFDDLILRRAPDGEGLSLNIYWATQLDSGGAAIRPSEIDWPLEKDLSYRAYQLVRQVIGKDLPLRATLIKRIPVGGGLGGGSADAAAMLAGLSLLFGNDPAFGPWPMDHLLEVSSALGSDVRFFLDESRPAGYPRPAIVTGFGESVKRLESFQRPVVLMIPDYPIATGPVYQAFDKPHADHSPKIDLARVEQLASQGAAAPTDQLFNDLTRPAREVEPRLGALIDRMKYELRTPVHVTGSGSTLYALPQGRKELAVMLKTAKSLEAQLGMVVTSAQVV